MGHPNEDLVRKGYDAFTSGDMDTLTTLMTDDISHTAPGNNPTSGEHEGHDDVFKMYGDLFERSGGTLEIELLDVTAKGDDKVVSRHHATAQRGDKKLDVEETLEFTIVGGKIAHIDESSSDVGAEDAFWSD